MIKFRLIISLILIFLVPFVSGFISSGQEETGGFIKFKIKNAGINVEGFFETFSSDIVYKKDEPENSKFTGIIQVSSINTGNNMRDGHLKKEEYFDMAKYPEIKFASTKVQEISKNRLRVSGNLTIKNTVKDIVLEVTVSESAGRTIFLSGLSLNRRDFGVGGKSWILSDDVNIELRIIK